ncbi:MAG: hypothetical protein KDC95_20350 [Planctomycetes bacterium]|nr:hypothetical protein [Planctomycetota bacterium]
MAERPQLILRLTGVALLVWVVAAPASLLATIAASTVQHIVIGVGGLVIMGPFMSIKDCDGSIVYGLGLYIGTVAVAVITAPLWLAAAGIYLPLAMLYAAICQFSDSGSLVGSLFMGPFAAVEYRHCLVPYFRELEWSVDSWVVWVNLLVAYILALSVLVYIRRNL